MATLYCINAPHSNMKTAASSQCTISNCSNCATAASAIGSEALVPSNYRVSGYLALEKDRITADL